MLEPDTMWKSDCNFVRHCICVDKYVMFITFAFVNVFIIELKLNHDFCDFRGSLKHKDHAISFMSYPRSLSTRSIWSAAVITISRPCQGWRYQGWCAQASAGARAHRGHNGRRRDIRMAERAPRRLQRLLTLDTPQYLQVVLGNWISVSWLTNYNPKSKVQRKGTGTGADTIILSHRVHLSID